MMISVQKWRWSWSLVAVVTSAVVLVSAVHLFLVPAVPSFEFLSAVPCNATIAEAAAGRSGGEDGGVRREEASESRLDFSLRFRADSRGVVIYHNASWKAEIGQWLSDCNGVSHEVEIVEHIGGRRCKNDCNGQGVCNHELGLCRCFHGFSGEDCSKRLDLKCNYEKGPQTPFARQVRSICAAHCDTTKAKCFCGEGTKYPNRPVAQSCGFKVYLPMEPTAPKVINWSIADPDIFTTNGSKKGWCNVAPIEAYSSKMQFKGECVCDYDCLVGRFCEVPVQCICVNQCSGNGHCRSGFCQCNKGWHGTDCSIPSVHSLVEEWPIWLRPSKLEVHNNTHVEENTINLSAMVKKRRPLIYVYDLPSDFYSVLLEGRHYKSDCVNRVYNEKNATIWEYNLYGAQMSFYESLLATPHRTLNGEEADYFFVPIFDSCIIQSADKAPHFSTKEHRGSRSWLTLEYYRKAHDHIVEKYPYWNHSQGRDHIWFFSWDESACCAPKEIWNSMMLVHYGNTNSKHNHSTTAFPPDNWDRIPPELRGNHPCFDPTKDLVVPSWKSPDLQAMRGRYWARRREERKTFFYFNGNLGPAYVHGRPGEVYSMGIRQKLGEEFGSSPNKEGKLGRQHAQDVIVTPVRTANYHKDLANSIFCGVFPGDGWSGRIEDSVLQGCIPVIIQDGIYLPYENFLNYKSFSVRLSEDDIPNMINILRNINKTEIESMMSNLQKIWQRFLYKDTMMLEAERQKTTFNRVDAWASEVSQLDDEDDVFTTILQILHYKLHNDPWRQQLARQKDYGIPPECLVKS